MSNTLAIGTVTAVLKRLLNERLNEAWPTGESPQVTVIPPDLVAQGEGDGKDQLNLFLYRVAPNIGWQNRDYPARNSQGNRINRPPLALDLHYLLSAYSKTPYRAEIMLGCSMQVLHEAGCLPRNLIEHSLLQFNGLPESTLAASTLAEQVELVKISPEALSTEEISKLWAAFQTNYRPTVGYHVSVVLIETDFTPKPALPVVERRVFAMPFKRPVIERTPTQMLGVDSTLILQGHSLRADRVDVQFSNGSLATPIAISDTQISVSVPDGLSLGTYTARVVHSMDFANQPPSDWREGAKSNPIAFMLIPTINLTTTSINSGNSEAVSLTVSPAVTPEQRVTLWLNGNDAELEIALPERQPEDSPETTLQFPMPNVLSAGDYLVRLEVDGIYSLLEVDTNNSNETFNQYIGPNLEVT